MLEQVMADNGFPVPLVEGGNCRVFQFHSGTGEGIMTQYDLFPGVSLMYNDFHMESYDSAFRTTEICCASITAARGAWSTLPARMRTPM